MSFKSNSSIICLVLALSSFDCFLSVCLSSVSIYIIICRCLLSVHVFLFLVLLLFLLLLFISSLCLSNWQSYWLSFFSLTFHLFLSHSPSPTYSLSFSNSPLNPSQKPLSMDAYSLTTTAWARLGQRKRDLPKRQTPLASHLPKGKFRMRFYSSWNKKLSRAVSGSLESDPVWFFKDIIIYNSKLGKTIFWIFLVL